MLLIDDASTDDEIRLYLDSLDHPRIRKIRNEENLGFVRTVNRGFRETNTDVVILNSDTWVPPGWLRRLLVAASTDPKIATVTPLSDNAGAFSAPIMGERNETPPWLGRDAIGRIVAQSASRIYPNAPTGNGFCMFIRRRALNDVGDFDAEAFPRGYGEENDFCMRLVASGWRNVVDDATYVFHERSVSFGDEKTDLMTQGRAALELRHPTYSEVVRAFVSSPEMEAVRDRVRWTFSEPRDTRPRVLMLLHQGGGGTPATTMDLIAGLTKRFQSLVLRSNGSRIELIDGGIEAEPLDSWTLDQPLSAVVTTDPEYRSILAHVLTRYNIELMHVRHLIGHTFDAPEIARSLGIPVVLSFHDFYLVCPSIHLLDEKRSYCARHVHRGHGRLLATDTLGARWHADPQALWGVQVAKIGLADA